MQTSLSNALALIDSARRRKVRRLVVVRVLWVGFALCIICFYLDALLAFGAHQRLAIALGSVLALIATYMLTRRRLNRADNREKMLARLVEGEHQQMNNELVNAIDFELRLADRRTDNVSVDLMKKGIKLAVDKFETVDSLNSLEPPTFGAELRVLCGALALWVLTGIIFHTWFLAELPRYLDPFGDHPPYSPTKLVVDPAGTTVDYGDNLLINVTAKAKIPKEVTLVMKNLAGEVVNEVPMFSSGEGKFFQTIEEIRSEMIYFARIERGRSKYYQIALSKTPRFESVQVRYHYPEYTRVPEKTAVLTEGLIKGYSNTKVTMTIKSNRPLKTAAVTVGRQTYTGQAAGQNSVDVAFTLTEKGPLLAEITDIEDNVCTEPFRGKVRIIPDGKPSVAIVSPGMNSFAIPTAKVPIVIEARDDLGVQRVSFFRNHNDSDDARKILFAANPGDTFIQRQETFDLEDLGVRPGDAIDYYATATDALPGTPQTVASQSFKLQIISQEEYAKFMQTKMSAKDLRLKYDQILANIEEIVEAQEQLERETKEAQDSQDGLDSQAMNDRLKKLAQRQSELAERSKSLAGQFEKEAAKAPVFDIEKDYKKTLSQLAQRLQKAQDHMNSSAKNIEDGAASAQNCSSRLGAAREDQKKALEQLGREARQMKEAIQQANKEIEKMIDLMTDVEIFKQLYLAQKNLTRQVRSLKEINNPDFDQRIRLKELAENQSFVEDQLDELKQNLKDHAAQIEDEYPKVAQDACSIAKEIQDRLICQTMQEAAVRLNQGSGRTGHVKVREALEQMEAMISFCKGAAGSGKKQCEFRLKIQMALEPGNTMSQLAQNFGSGGGTGQIGAFGRGSAGFGGGQSNFAVFGDDTFGPNMLRESSMAGVKRVKAQALKGLDKPDPLAGNIEELGSQETRDLELEAVGDSRMMAEYSRLIEAYFQRLAEEE
jgi:hypothetical protein